MVNWQLLNINHQPEEKATMRKDYTTKLANVIEINESQIQDHLGELVRGTVEETINAMLDAEADALCNAVRYERSAARKDTRAGYYKRGPHTKADEVKLKVPKLRQQKFETAIIERHKRRKSSVEEALVEMYLAGVSVRRVEDITEALWGTKVKPCGWLRQPCNLHLCCAGSEVERKKEKNVIKRLPQKLNVRKRADTA